jgi:hypothetical protein
MFKWRPPREKTGLEKARDEALSELQGFTADTAEYKQIMKHVKELTKLIDLEKSERVSPNTLLVVLGNVGIAVLVVAYEHHDIVTTKVLGFLHKTPPINR